MISRAGKFALLSSGLLFAILFLLYPGWITHLFDLLLSTKGDGFKNYYTLWFHVIHDDKALWFSGMNHPFGEHILFTDAQPALAVILQFIHQHLIPLDHAVPGIMHLALLFSFLLSGYILTRILLHYNIPPWLAVASAIILTLLSPQLLRWSGHYALGYLIYIPLIWWLSIRWENRQSIRNCIPILISVIFFAFIHPYYLMMTALFLGCWSLIRIFFTRHQFKKQAFFFLFSVLIPLIFFFLIVKLTDPVTDRPESPQGLLKYRTSWISVFYPVLLDDGKIWKDAEQVEFEGIAYVGFLTLFGLALLGMRYVQIIFRRDKGRIFRPVKHMGLWMFFVAGFICLLISMRYPFVSFLRTMPEHLPYYNQFRGIGRFAWIFYYTGGVFSVYLIWSAFRVLRLRMKKPVLIIMVTLPLLAAMIEVLVYHRYLKQERFDFESVSVLMDETKEALKDVETDAYESFVYLPYFHEGSENFIVANTESAKEAFLISLASGLPMQNVMMSRTSVSQTKMQLQLLSEGGYEIPILEKLDQPLLIVKDTSREMTFPAAIVQHAKHVGAAKEKFLFYDYQPGAWRPGKEEAQPQVERYIAGLDTAYHFRDSLWTNEENPSVAIRHFDMEKDAWAYKGSGGAERTGWAYNYLWNGKIRHAKQGMYSMSLWIWLGEDERAVMDILIQTRHEGEIEVYHLERISTMIRAFDGEWALVQREFWLNDPEDEIQILIRHDAKRPELVRYDEFMLRHVHTHVFGSRNGDLFFDNRYY